MSNNKDSGSGSQLSIGLNGVSLKCVKTYLLKVLFT